MAKIRYVALLCLLMCMTSVVAQKVSVSGRILDGESNEGMPGASVVLLTTDSVQVTGVSSDTKGRFKLPAVQAGSYLLKASYIGYMPQFTPVTLIKGNRSLVVGDITLLDNAKLMKEAEVTAKLAQMEMKADTFVYNADAYRLPEGSALEELVRKLPGAEVDDQGNIKINGKSISKIMVGGKEFFGNDTKVAMKNITPKMIEKLKAYDRKSDYSRITGIDDGEEETVLDLTVKKGMRDGWLLNANVAGGNKDRYSVRLNADRYTDHSSLTTLASRNNINDGNGRWGGGGGITTSNNAGINFAWDNNRRKAEKGYLEMGGNVRWNQSKSTNESHGNSEMMLSELSSTFNNNRNRSLSHRANVNVNFRLEWQPDTMTNITFRPNFSHSEGDSWSESASVTFNKNPYEAGMLDPLAEYKTWASDTELRVNGNERLSSGDNSNNNANASLQLNRRLGKGGRNLTFDVDGSYSKSENSNYSRSLVHYYQSTARSPLTATYQNTTSPSKNYSYQGRVSYSEPIFPGANLQFSYQAQRRFQDNNRELNVYDHLADALLSAGLGDLTVYDLYNNDPRILAAGIDLEMLTKDMVNSQYATYKEFNQNITTMFRYNRKMEDGSEMRVNAGVTYQPQRTHMDYAKASVDTSIVRKVQNWSPRIDMRWKMNDTRQLRVRYNGRMGQPSMTNLIEVMDSSDPLHISTGNAGLRSSWSDRFNVDFNDYNVERQRGYWMGAYGNINRRNISNSTLYDAQTGVRYSRPLNIDGTWNAGAWLGFNSALDAKKMWNLNMGGNFGYNNNVGYLSSDLDAGARYFQTSGANGGVDMDGLFNYMDDHNLLRKATTRGLNAGMNMRLNVRGEMMGEGSYEVGVNGNGTYNHSRNDIQTTNNLDTWWYSYGGYFQVNFPWGMTISSDLNQQSRRGYEDASMNTNELIWNATIQQNFRKLLNGHDLTLSFQAYDILAERSNVNRNISATMRSDTYTNAIHSYFMFHIIYKLNLMGDKEARQNAGFGGPRGGGFGGGRGVVVTF